MSKLANYIVSATWFNDSGVTLQVDHEVLTSELATEINNFWGAADARLDDEDGDAVRAAIRLFGSTAIRFFMSDGGASFDSLVEGAYWTQKVLDDQGEGWPSLAGLGILIAAADVSAVDYDDVTLVQKDGAA